MIVLDEKTLRDLVSMDDAIKAVRQGFIALSSGQVEQPPRLALADGTVLLMLAASSSDPGTVVKIVSIRIRRGPSDQPSLHGVVIWLDGRTGRPTALIEGSALTALRTGAASGVATALLAPPSCQILAMLGAGGQAADQIRAIVAVRKIREIRVFSRTEESSQLLMTRLERQLPEIAFRVCHTADEAVANADVVCCATPSQAALFRAESLADGCHINAIGSYRRDMCELAPEVFERARIVVVDQKDAALAEAGDVIQAIDAGRLRSQQLVELGTALAQGVKTSGKGCSIFKSVGVAVQDWAVARIAVERAEGRQLGYQVPLWPAPS